MGIGAFVFLLFASAIIVVIALLWVARGVDDSTWLLCRDAVRRLGRDSAFVPGRGFRPNRIVSRATDYELVAALHPGRRTGFRLDLELTARGGEYRELLVWERGGRLGPSIRGRGRLEERRTPDPRFDAVFAVRGTAAAAARLGEEARAILTRGRTALPGELAIDRGVIRHDLHQGALLDAGLLADIIGTAASLHRALAGAPPHQQDHV